MDSSQRIAHKKKWRERYAATPVVGSRVSGASAGLPVEAPLVPVPLLPSLITNKIVAC